MITLEKHNNAFEMVNDCERQKVSHQKGSRAFVMWNSKGQFVEFNKLWKKKCWLFVMGKFLPITQFDAVLIPADLTHNFRYHNRKQHK